MATILVVDDEPTILDALAEVLREEGHAVLAAGDGAAALGLLARGAPDLVITDTMMPGLDGPGLVRRMRARPELREAPVLLASAVARPPWDGLGDVAFLPKPFDLGALLAAVATLVGDPAANNGP